jgi:catechol 2,3-dioxygenase-like lactoylglutathione lyase family enzyme
MRRAVHKGLRHVALRVTNLARSRAFYEALLGMQVVWEPDADNVYLSSGTDNLVGSHGRHPGGSGGGGRDVPRD